MNIWKVIIAASGKVPASALAILPVLVAAAAVVLAKWGIHYYE